MKLTCYRISGGAATLFYAPDVLDIPHRAAALRGVRLYVGDGATLGRPIVRVRGDRVLVGHAPVLTQLQWCQAADVPRAIFTHCGKHIVAGGPWFEQKVAALGETAGVEAQVAYDGLQITVR